MILPVFATCSGKGEGVGTQWTELACPADGREQKITQLKKLWYPPIYFLYDYYSETQVELHHKQLAPFL
jgi:hypothetical protein